MNKRRSRSEPPEYIYGIQNGSLYILPKSAALWVGAVYKALRNSRTWGEFRAAVDADDYAAALALAGVTGEDDEEAQEPSPSDAFNGNEFIIYAEGSWPPYPEELMVDSLPEEIASKFGKKTTSMIGGSFLSIPIERERELVAALEQLGCKVARDDSLYIGLN